MSKEEDTKELEAQIAEFLAKGGKIKKYGYRERTDPDEIKNSWGHKKTPPKKTPQS